MTRLMITAMAVWALGSAAPAWSDEVYRLQVDGLACPFCAYGVEKKISAAAGVKKLDILMNAGEVVVTTEEGAGFNEELARRLVADSGFTMRGFSRVEPSQLAEPHKVNR